MGSMIREQKTRATRTRVLDDLSATCYAGRVRPALYSVATDERNPITACSRPPEQS